MRMRVGRAVAAVAVVSAVISGCGGPEQPGTAVAIGDRTIPLSQVESEVDAVLSDPGERAIAQSQGQQLTDLARSVVGARVTDSVVTPVAAAAGVVVPAAEVDLQIDNIVVSVLGGQSQEKLTPDDKAKVKALYGLLRRQVPAQLAAVELARRQVGGISVTVDEVPVRDRTAAEKLAGTLAAGGAAADAVMAGPGARRGVTYRATDDAERAGSILFGVPQGTVVAYRPSAGNANWSVAKVTVRRTDGPVDDQAVDSLSQQDLLPIGFRIAQAQAGEVTVNPRYGVWDPVAFAITRPGDATGIVLLPS